MNQDMLFGVDVAKAPPAYQAVFSAWRRQTGQDRPYLAPDAPRQAQATPDAAAIEPIQAPQDQQPATDPTVLSQARMLQALLSGQAGAPSLGGATGVAQDPFGLFNAGGGVGSVFGLQGGRANANLQGRFGANSPVSQEGRQFQALQGQSPQIAALFNPFNWHGRAGMGGMGPGGQSSMFADQATLKAAADYLNTLLAPTQPAR